LKNFNYENIGYYKYKSFTPIIVDCIKEYFILEKIKNKEIVWEFEMENGTPKLLNGKLIILV